MLSRLVITVGGAALLMLVIGLPALADPWGSVDCGQSPTPACELGAGKGGDGGDRQGHLAQKPPLAPHGDQPDGGDHVVGADRPVHCSYVRSDYQPPTTGVATVAYQRRDGNGALKVRPAMFWRPLTSLAVPAAVDPTPGQPGAWYVYKCDQSGVIDALYRAPVWMPDGRPAGPSPAQLAEQARSQLQLPSPSIVANPAGTQLVNLPMWLWVDPASWGARSATAAVPGVVVTAVARPRSVSWSLGDGTSLTCPGQGTPFPAGGDPRAASPDCGHIYRSSSAAQMGQAFPVVATVHWAVTWAGAGQGGAFPDLTTTSATGLRVAEAQALGNGPR